MIAEKAMRAVATAALSLVLLAFGVQAAPNPVAQPGTRGHALILFSYGDGGKGVEIFRDEFRGVLDEAGVDASDVFFEYLDLERAKKVPDYRARLRGLLLDKYANGVVRVIVTAQQPALEFLLEEGRQLAPEAPVIAVQAPVPTAEQAHGRRVISQLAHFDIRGTLERALELFPDTRHVLFVAGSSEADRDAAAEAMKVAAPWRGRMTLETTCDLTVAQAVRHAAELPPHSIIVFTQFNRDASGHVALAYEVERAMARAANAPVFGLYDFNLHNGGIGGSVISVKELGHRTAALVLDILDGTFKPSASLLSLDNKAMPMFDWGQIKRWGGHAERLPDASVFLNRDAPFWQGHEKVVSGVLLIVVVQMLTIAGLAVSRRRRMAAESALLESEDRYRERLDEALTHKRQYEEGLERLLALNRHASGLTEQQICDLALDAAVAVTRSEAGCLHLLDDDQATFSSSAWSAGARARCAAGRDGHSLRAVAGVWADCVRTRKPVVHNQGAADAGRNGFPPGHVDIVRYLTVPVVEADAVRMVIGVANKDSDYLDEDVQQLQLVASEVQKIVMRRRTEWALHESESRFRFIADLSPSLVWVVDKDKRCTWVNKTWQDFTGRAMEQEAGDGWLASVDPLDLERWRVTFARHFERRRPFRMEYRLRRHDGSYRWVLNAGQPRFDEETGDFRGYVGSCLDITDRREVEQQLRMLWLATEQSPDSIMITDLDGRIEYVNEAFIRTSGYGRPEVLGQNPRMLQSGETPAATYQAMWRALSRGEDWEGEFVNRRKNGETYVESARISPVRQPEGRISHFVGIKVDITERRRTENAILESKALLQAVIDSTPDWIYVRDREHRFMLVNRSFAEAFKRMPEQMIGRHDTDFLPAEMCRAGEGHDDDLVFAGIALHDPSERFAIRHGDVRYFDTFKGPLRDPLNRVYGSLTYRRDTTEQHRKGEEQQILETQLRQAQKMELIGHLTGGIAHDFNNILAAMFGYAELAQMSPVLQQNAQLAEYLTEILRAGIRAKELVSQLLTFSRRKETVSEAIAIAPIVKEVAKLLRSTMPATISINTSVAKSLPQVLISAVHLHQVVMNLGVNARDAMADKGTIDIRVEAVSLGESEACDSCHLNYAGDFVVIAVKDTGSGIAGDHLQKIFDPFFTTKEVGRGTGLGLSVLHGIVHSAHGHIRVLTAPGTGSEFRIFLPAQQREPARHGLDTRPDADRPPFDGHVLIVDDDPSIVKFMTALLGTLGCRTSGVASATEALRLFERDPQAFDLVITDQTMPDLTGAELARAMLARRPELPVVLCTGYSSTFDDEDARRVGIRRFLMKPVPARVLSDVVMECLAGKG